MNILANWLIKWQFACVKRKWAQKNGCSFAICYARKEIGVRTKKEYSIKNLWTFFLCLEQFRYKKLLIGKKIGSSVKYENFVQRGCMSSESQFFRCHFLAPRFPLKFFSASIRTFWAVDALFLLLFMFCSQKNKNSIENASNFNQIATKQDQWWSLRFAQQEIEIDFMMSFHCFSHFIWLLIVAVNIFFVISNKFGGKILSR